MPCVYPHVVNVDDADDADDVDAVVPPRSMMLNEILDHKPNVALYNGADLSPT